MSSRGGWIEVGDNGLGSSDAFLHFNNGDPPRKIGATLPIASVSALRGLTGDQAGSDHLFALCRETTGDGFGGDFCWDSESMDDDDDGIVIRPASVSPGAPGRWLRSYSGLINVGWYGAGQNNAAQDTAAIQAILNIVSSVTAPLSSIKVIFPCVNAVSGGYLINAQLVLQGSLSNSVLLEGEAQAGSGPFAVRLFWAGASNFAGSVLECVGTTGLKIKNLTIDGRGKAKWCLGLAPDQTHSIGSNGTILEDVALISPWSTAGGGALRWGQTYVGEPSQCDLIRCYNCVFSGDAPSTGPSYGYLADGIVNTHGGNTKLLMLVGCTFYGFRYAFNLELTSGPVLMYGGTASGCTGGLLYGSSMNVVVDGVDFEGIASLIRNPGVGSPFGSVTFRNCECYLQAYTVNNLHPTDFYDYAIDWYSGRLEIIGGSFQNTRNPSITNATNATPIVCTTPGAGHGLKTGDNISVISVGGNTAANGFWSVTVTDANHFSLDGSVGSGAYTSGGSFIPEMKFRIYNQDPATNTGISSISIRDANFVGSKDTPRVEDTNGNLLFNRAFVLAQAFEIRAEQVNNVYSQVGTGSPFAMKSMSAMQTRMLAIKAGLVSADANGILQGAPATATYTGSNHTDSRTLNETGATLVQLANVVGTLVNDLRARGIIL